MQNRTQPVNGYLAKRTFFLILGILVTVLLALFAYLAGRVDKVSETFNHNFTEVKVDIGKIQTDLRLLREGLK